MTADQLRAHALATGSEATIGGRPFNTARAVVAPKPAAPKAVEIPPNPAPALAAPPAPETFTRAEVDQMLADQERRLTDRMTQLFASLARPAEPDADDLKPAGLKPTYNADGSIAFIGIDWQRMQ